MTEFSVCTGRAPALDFPCIIGGVYADAQLPRSTVALDKACGGSISKRLKAKDHDGNHRNSLVLFDLPNVKAERVILVGLGKKEGLDCNTLRKAADTAWRAMKNLDVDNAAVLFVDEEVKDATLEIKARLIVESIVEAGYRFRKSKLKSGRSSSRTEPRAKIALAVTDRRKVKRVEQGVRQGQAIGEGRNLTRELGNLPANVCTPSYLSSRAKRIARHSNIKTTVFDESQIKELGMRTFLAVSAGSRKSAQLIQMEYAGASGKTRPVVLIGKGITFDSGGISLKPADHMDEMKFDMCGAASVFGTMYAAAKLALNINIIGLVPACENLPDSRAIKPGDVIESMSGRTVEILDTDAEGRLILCDALTYASQFKPEAVIDIATLTGACVAALGHHASGLFANAQALADDLLAAGERASDRAWQLPLWDEYQRHLDSNFADMANVGGSSAGAITAACFLSRFTKDYPWAHLDIAGTAWRRGSKKGATGRSVGLLTEYLMNKAELS